MADINYNVVLRGVYRKLNALKSDTVTLAETSLKSSSLTPDATVINPLFPPVGVQHTILLCEKAIARTICQTEGHPQRARFSKLVTLQHGGNVPASVGGIGAVYKVVSGSKKYLFNRTLDVVEKLRTPADFVMACATVPTDYFWGWDGSLFFATVDGDIIVEVYDPQFEALTAFNYDTIFAEGGPTSPISAKLPDEFQPAWEFLAAGLEASLIGTFPNESSTYLQTAAAMLEDQHINAKMVLDYASSKSPSR